jgi:HEAT repeat protein
MYRHSIWCIALAAAVTQPSVFAAGAKTISVDEWQIKGILAALNDGYPGVRVKAAIKLASLVNRRADSNNPERKWNGNFLEMANKAVVLAEMDCRKLLDDPDTYVRVAAVTALAELNDRDAIDDLRKRLKDSWSDVRRAAAQALGKLGAGQAVLPDLRNLLEDDYPQVSHAAAEALGDLSPGDPIGEQRLLGLIKTDDPIRSSGAIRGLGLLQNVKEISKVTPYLKASHWAVREAAAEALGQLASDKALGDAARQEVIDSLILLLRDSDFKPRAAAADSLGRLGAKAAVRPLLNLFTDQDSAVSGAAAEALGEINVEAEDVKKIEGLLGDSNPDVRVAACLALSRLKASDALEFVRPLLDDPDPNVWAMAALTLGQFKDTKAISKLRARLADKPFQVRQAAIKALGDLRAQVAAPDFRAGLLDPNDGVRFAAVQALRQVNYDEAIQDIRGRLADRNPKVRQAAAAIIETLEPGSIIPLLQLPYEDSSSRDGARWLAHFLGRGEELSETQCAYLGRPATAPDLPATTDESRTVLDILEKAWDESDSRWLREDAASWASLIITQHGRDWTFADKQMLQGFRDRLAKDQKKTRALAYVPAIQSILAPLDTPLPPWVWTVLAVAIINVVAVLLFLLRPGRGALEKWLPFLAYSTAGVGAGLTEFWTQQLHLDLRLLGGLLIGELIVLLAAGVVSPAVLRQLAKVEPLNRVVVPLALRFPWSRRRLFRNYVLAVRNQLERDMRQANNERYITVPADMSTNRAAKPGQRPDPATDILQFLTGSEAGHVLIEAPGGRGKSALLREVVERALKVFESDPAKSRLPVLLTGTGESLEKMAEAALQPVLLMPEMLAVHLEAGDFFLVLDGVSESGLSDKVLSSFVQGQYGDATPLLLGARPTRAYRNVIEGAAHWMTAEPRRLDETTLVAFITHYGGRGLSEPIKAACRGRDQTYLPILVRMAMTLGGDGDSAATVADVYRGYFLRLFEAQFPDEAKRFKRLDYAARWCLATYWKDGLRRRTYDASAMQQGLLQAGVLIPADSLVPTGEVQFFHDSMQSFLTAHGLGVLDAAADGYGRLPRPKDARAGGSWDRGRVLLWAAANAKFTKARADILPTGGTELFQMYLAAFRPWDELRPWLHGELKKWAQNHDEDLRRKDVLEAIPSAIVTLTKGIRGAGKLLAAAADACLDADERQGSLELLGILYARIAPLVYDLREGGAKQQSATTPLVFAAATTGGRVA